MIVLTPRSALTTSANSTFSPISSSMTQAGNPSSPNGSSPTGEEMNPIAMAINCMNGEVKQESMHARSFQQFTLPHQQMAMATALSPSMTSVPSPPQSQQHSILASMLTQHSLHNQSPSSPSHSTSPSSMHNPNIIYTDSSSTEPEFVQLSIPEDNQLLEMAAAEAGIVAPIMNQPGQQQQTIQQPPMNPKLNAQLEQQLQDQFRPEDFLPITTQNQSISQMITTYAANEMNQQDILAYSNQQYHQQQYMDQQEMMHNNGYYYNNHHQQNNSIDEGVGEVPLTPTHTASSQMGGETMMDAHNMNNNNNNHHCVRRGQFQTPPPLQSVGQLTNIPPESLQSPDSGYGDICSTPKTPTTNLYQDRFFQDQIYHQQQQHHPNSYMPNGIMYTMDNSQMSPIDSIPSPVKTAHNNSTLMNSSMASSGFGPASPEIKQEPSTKQPTLPSLRVTQPQIQIEKVNDPSGFQYTLETPISTAQRVDEDRMTYVNKGQFYQLTVNYKPYENPADNIRTNAPVKTVVMVVFREEKSPENELKAWGFWHARQHTIKQRILDADSKASVGILGSCEEIAHNGVAFHWSPKEGPAKLSVAVQCLSTDFSNQKGVKGVAMHLQIDTYATDTNSRIPLHRAYSQIKVFCDKGAERKTRDEDRRISKRKQNHAGRRKIEDLYHPKCDRTEFYQMADLVTQPVLFNPSEQNGYLVSRVDINASNAITSSVDAYSESSPTDSNFSMKRTRDDALLDNNGNILEPSASPPLAKRPCFMGGNRSMQQPQDQVIIQIKDHPTANTELIVTPPTLEGLGTALENKYNIQANLIEIIYKQSRRGVLVRMDNDLVRHYADKGEWKLDVKTTDDSKYRITFSPL